MAHKAKEYADVFCSVVINIKCNEFNSPPEECKQYTATVWSTQMCNFMGCLIITLVPEDNT